MAFEPDPQAFELLESNIRNNRLDHVICYNESVTNNVGVAELFKGEIPGSLGMSLIEMPTAFRQTVRTIRLSEFIHNDVDFLKIDVEGSEIQIIEDLLETGTIQFVKQMVIEFHPSKIARDIQDFLDALTNCDFDFYERSEAFPKSSDRLFYFRKRLT
jgi:FkbM family methyltransferase